MTHSAAAAADAVIRTLKLDIIGRASPMDRNLKSVPQQPAVAITEVIAHVNLPLGGLIGSCAAGPGRSPRYSGRVGLHACQGPVAE